MHPRARGTGGGAIHHREPALHGARDGRKAVATRDVVLRCASLARDKKARDIRILEVREVSSFTDWFLLCSGTSDRQVTAVAQHIEDSLRREGIRPIGTEGGREGRWVLLDYGDFVVHVFLESVREFFQFDRLWGAAPEVPLPVEP